MTLRVAKKEISALAALLALCAFLPGCAPPPPAPPGAEALGRFLEESGKSPVFTNPAIAGLAGNAPSRDDAEACLAPDKWRSLHRAQRYRAVALAGPLWEYEPLLHHLLGSPDWQLARVDDTGFVFFPASGENQKFVLPGSEALFPDSSDPVARARRMAAMAENLALAGMPDHETLLGQASAISPDDPVILAHAAAIDIRAQSWTAAEKSARLALEKSPRFTTARYLLIQALLGRGRADDAYAESRRLAASEPRDIPILFLHARTAHAARAFQDEAATLEKLIALCQRSGIPEDGYRVYLGQAYAKLGRGPQAIEQFDMSLQSPLIDEPSKARIRETVGMIRSRQSPQ